MLGAKHDLQSHLHRLGDRDFFISMCHNNYDVKYKRNEIVFYCMLHVYSDCNLLIHLLNQAAHPTLCHS